ncbi:thiol reductant ABC exporter subunit CydD [Alphaproteobacteria bacterium]|nr:thiol reductant ABC exporter subunit CydD [Alphaproteobacteria bacterium]
MDSKNLKSERQKNRAWLKKHKKLCLPWTPLSYASEVVQVVAAICFSYFLSHLLVYLFSHQVSERFSLTIVISSLLGFASLRGISIALQPWFGEKAAEKVKSKVRLNLHAQILAAGPSIKNKISAGSVASTLVDQIEALSGYFARYQTKALAASTLPLLFLSVIYLVNWKLALVMAFAWVLVPFAMAMIGIAIAKASQSQVDELTRLGGHFLDRIQGLTSLRLFGQADAEVKRTEAAADRFRRKTMSVLKLAFLSSTTLELIATGALFLTAVYVTSALIGSIGLQQGLFVLILVPEFFLPLRQFTAAYHEQSAAMSAAQKIRELEGHLTNTADTKNGSQSSIKLAEVPKIEVQDLAFAYDDEQPVLNKLSFSLSPGSLTVLQGPSGVGKSTLLSLLLGFTDGYRGSIKLDGSELSTLDKASLREAVCWSGQHPYLFHGSLRDNLLLANPSASDQNLSLAVEKAGLESFIQSLPKGLESHLQERGSNLSGGQLQRIALARAFLKEGSLLILDEPLTALDPKTRAAIIKSISELRTGKTTLIASHDPELIKIADQVIKLPFATDGIAA